MSFNTGSQELQSFIQSVCILFCEWAQAQSYQEIWARKGHLTLYTNKGKLIQKLLEIKITSEWITVDGHACAYYLLQHGGNRVIVNSSHVAENRLCCCYNIILVNNFFNLLYLREVLTKVQNLKWNFCMWLNNTQPVGSPTPYLYMEHREQKEKRLIMTCSFLGARILCISGQLQHQSQWGANWRS